MALTDLTKTRARWATFKLKAAKAVSRSLYEKLLDQGVSVKDFGAVGDGVTDDSEAFKLAAMVSDNVFIPAGTFLYDSDEPIVARENLTIFGVSRFVSKVKMGSSSKGGYGFISNPNKVNSVTLTSFSITGTNTSRAESSSDTDTFPINLIELNECNNVVIHKVNIDNWWAYYNHGNERSPGVVSINNVSNAEVTYNKFHLCGNEVITAKNNTDGVFDNLVINTPLSNAQKVYSALTVIADNPEGKQNTVSDCVINNIKVRGATGSAVNFTGSRSIIT